MDRTFGQSPSLEDNCIAQDGYYSMVNAYPSAKPVHAQRFDALFNEPERFSGMISTLSQRQARRRGYVLLQSRNAGLQQEALVYIN